MKQLNVKLILIIVFALISLSWVTFKISQYYVPTNLDDFFMPGSQPTESGTFDSPSQCDNCHANYDSRNIEPYETWAGSMMAHSMRDPYFWLQ